MSAPELRPNDLYNQLRSGTGEGALFANLFVAPDGKVEECEVYYSKVSKAQSAKFCSNAIGLTVSSPAVGPDGKPEFGILDFGRIVIRTTSSGPSTAPKFELPPDLEVNVNALPDEHQNKLRTRLAILVDDHGVVAACQPDQDTPADYAKVACDQVQQLTTQVRKNAGGSAVRYVTGFVVDFVKDRTTG
ncbi:MAG TPA: hypothetical protein VLM18_12370 [Croceibacterium sp.]|nr:hypothetical protein [Croceibacterium sp.]